MFYKEVVIVPKGEYQIVERKEGSYVIIYDGHLYRSNKTNQHVGRYWRCCRCKIKCKTNAVLLEDGTLRIRGQHNHPPSNVLPYFQS